LEQYGAPVIAAGSEPYEAVVGRDGAIWFTEYGRNKIGRIDPTTKVVTELADVGGGGPLGITVGPDGAIWFADNLVHKIGRINPLTHVITHALTGSLAPWAITRGSDDALWFTVSNGQKIGRYNLATGGITRYPTLGLPGAYPYIVSGPDGNLWSSEYASGRIARINPVSKAITEFAIPTLSSGPTELTLGADHAIWFTEYGSAGPGGGGAKIGRITTSGAITEYNVQTPASGPFGITAGADGAIWFGEFSTNKVGRVSLTGAVTEYAAAGTGPAGMVSGPDGAIWFAAYSSNKIGRITTGIPGRPIGVVAVATANALRVGWAPPTDAGVNSISQYVVTAYPGGRSCVTSALKCVVSSLTNGVAYRVVVRAQNGAGSGALSAWSNVAIPRSFPSEVRSLTAHTTTAGHAIATWAIPSHTGGIPIIGYLVRRLDRTKRVWTAWTRVTTRSASFAGLVKGHIYLVQVVAVNYSGGGMAAGYSFTQTK
jgi:virginiamycin B lyase